MSGRSCDRGAFSALQLAVGARASNSNSCRYSRDAAKQTLHQAPAQTSHRRTITLLSRAATSGQQSLSNCQQLTTTPALHRSLSRGIATTPLRHEAASAPAPGPAHPASHTHPQEERHPGSVHVRIEPRPRTLRESAEVLQALRRFGDVEMFRHLKYAPQAPAMHVALAIFRSPDAAARAIAASPIEFAFGGGLVDEARDDEVHRDAGSARAEALMAVEADAEELTGDEAANADDVAAVAMEEDEVDASEDPDFRSELDTEQDLVSAGDPTVFPPGRQSTAIKPPWEMALPRSESSSTATVTATGSSEAKNDRTSAVPQQDSTLDPASELEAELDTDLAPLLSIDPSRPISLPRMPERPPEVAAAPAYRHSALSPRARVHDTAPPPSFADDPTYAPAPRAATLVVSASGFAHRFYNARQPYFGSYAVSPAVYPGSGVLADLPNALRGLADSNLQKAEPVARQRARKEAKRLEGDALKGKSLREVWQEGARMRARNESNRIE